MPRLPPEPPEKVKAEDLQPDEDVVPVSFAPPSLVDIPNVVPGQRFRDGRDAAPAARASSPPRASWSFRRAGRPALARVSARSSDIDQLDQIPVARIQQKPIYPYEMQREGMNGEVNVGFIVDVNGDVRDAYVINSTRREFDNAAVQAVSKWKFRPGRKGGRPVNTRMSVPVVFNIQE